MTCSRACVCLHLHLIKTKCLKAEALLAHICCTCCALTFCVMSLRLQQREINELLVTRSPFLISLLLALLPSSLLFFFCSKRGERCIWHGRFQGLTTSHPTASSPLDPTARVSPATPAVISLGERPEIGRSPTGTSPPRFTSFPANQQDRRNLRRGPCRHALASFSIRTRSRRNCRLDSRLPSSPSLERAVPTSPLQDLRSRYMSLNALL